MVYTGCGLVRADLRARPDSSPGPLGYRIAPVPLSRPVPRQAPQNSPSFSFGSRPLGHSPGGALGADVSPRDGHNAVDVRMTAGVAVDVHLTADVLVDVDVPVDG